MPCDTEGNTQRIIEKYKQLAANGVKLAAFPELCVTGYTCGDFFKQKTLLQNAEKACGEICDATADYECVAVVGCPVSVRCKLYNCAVIIYKGKILGIVPKSYLPEYNEFDEVRQFAAAPGTTSETVFASRATPFGTKLIFSCDEMNDFTFAVEICEDMVVPTPPSTEHAQNGANIIVNIAASSEAVAKSAFRRNIVRAHSSRISVGYIYACTGDGESTSVCNFAGHSMISEAGLLLAESKPFEFVDCITEIDCERIVSGKRTYNTYNNAVGQYAFRAFSMQPVETRLTRYIPPYPFIPGKNRDETWQEILDLQSHGLKKRLEVSAARPVLNVSGGLDSTLAFIVCVETMKLMGRPVSDIICISSPCFGTTSRTKSNAETICKGMGADYRQINIEASVTRHFQDIGHSANTHDAAFENAQARERTQIAMDIANMYGGIMVGTGDMSELALGWATFNGDQMSMYSVNAGVPKSIIQYIIRYYADKHTEGDIRAAFCDICETPVSPELLPAENGEITQKTEDINGPYAIHDFILYYLIKYGFTPEKIYLLAVKAFDGIYNDSVLKSTFGIFYSRFISQQYKRSCGADSPKIGSVSVTPQNGWKAPADASVRLWEKQVKEIIQG